MSKKYNGTQTEDYLRKTQLPEATESYTVISHGSIIDRLREKLAENGFNIKSELYKATDAGDVAMGFIHIENDKDPDMGMTFNWTNSYNKKIRFGCSVGGFIYDNKVPFISSSDAASWLRKHTGTADSEAYNMVDSMIESANDHFDNIIKMKEKFKAISVSRKEYAKLIGLLYLDKKILCANQVGIIRQEYDKPSFDYQDKGTLWELYKMIMFSIVDNPPKKWYDQQLQISAYIQVMHSYSKAPIFEEHIDDEPIENEQEEFNFDSPVGSDYDIDKDRGFITDETEDEVMDSLFTPIQPTVEHQAEPISEENLASQLYGVDNNIEVTHNVIEKQDDDEVSDIIEDDDSYSFDEIVEEIEEIDNVAPIEMRDEEIDLIKEEMGVVEEEPVVEETIGAIEESVESLFDLIEDEDDDSADEVPWFTDEEEKPSLIPDRAREQVAEMLESKYLNKRNVVNTIEAEGCLIFELDSKEFFVID